MSFSTVLSAAVEGLRVEPVHGEADGSSGLPVFHMVGYLSSEVTQAGERPASFSVWLRLRSPHSAVHIASAALQP